MYFLSTVIDFLKIIFSGTNSRKDVFNEVASAAAVRSSSDMVGSMVDSVMGSNNDNDDDHDVREAASSCQSLPLSKQRKLGIAEKTAKK